MLSVTLKLTGQFDLFLQITAALTLVGSASFLPLNRPAALGRRPIEAA